MTSKPLQDDARLLDRAGIPTRFVSLGRFGHGYPADMEARMREPMAWVAGAPAERRRAETARSSDPQAVSRADRESSRVR